MEQVSKIAVIVPTFKRHSRMERVARNILERSDTPVVVVFSVETDDMDSRAEASKLNVEGLCEWTANCRSHNYAGAVNSAFRSLDAPPITHIFLAADDLDFHQGWDAVALAALKDGKQVAGTNDLHNPSVLAGVAATHYLIDVEYLHDPGGVPGELPGNVLFEGYDHNFTDTEFIAAAKARGVFTPCLESVVEHLHPVWGRGQWDDTYAKGQRGMGADQLVFNSRQHLWS